MDHDQKNKLIMYGMFAFAILFILAAMFGFITLSPDI
jgi:hypothetical protein